MPPEQGVVGEDDLQALVDGRLPLERRVAVEAYLAGRPEQAARVGAYQAQREALRARLRPRAEEAIPPRLRVAGIIAERRGRQRRRLAAAAAAVAWLVVGAASGWYANEALAPSPEGRLVVADALVAHQTFVAEVAHPVEVDAGREAHLVQWLSNRLGRRLATPDLSALGFRLMGGRLLPAGDRPAAQFMYEDGDRRRLTIYVRAVGGGEAAFRFVEEGGLGAFYWLDRGIAYAVAANAERGALLHVAEAVHHQLVPPASD